VAQVILVGRVGEDHASDFELPITFLEDEDKLGRFTH
jgi:hypothetical protein